MTTLSDPDKWSRRPRIVLPEGLRSVADPWNPAATVAGADVRVARQLTDDGRQAFYIHVHSLRSGTTVRARLLCSYRGEVPQALSETEVGFYPGFVPDVNVRSAGLLKA